MTWIRHHTWQSLGTGVVSWHKWYVPFCVWAVLQSSLLSLAVEAQTKVTEHMMDCHKIESPKQLFDRLSEVSADWKILAEDLGVDTSTIDEIQLDEPKTKNKYRAVLHAWYDSKEPHPCWEPVLAVLRGMGRNRLAGEIDTCLSKGCNCELVPECTGTSQVNENTRGSLDEDTNYPEATPPNDYSSTGLDTGSVIVAVVIGAFGTFIFIICIRCWTRNQAGKKGNHPAPKSDDRQGQQSSAGANGATNTAHVDTSLTSQQSSAGAANTAHVDASRNSDGGENGGNTATLGRNKLHVEHQQGQQSSTGASNTARIDASQNSDGAHATDTRLCPADLAILLCILQSISRLWKEIGRELGIPAGDLGNIESAPRHLMGAPQSHFSAMLEKWLNWAPPNHSWPTLEQLCSALRSPVVGQENLANKLEQKYLLQKGEDGSNTAAIRGHTSHANGITVSKCGASVSGASVSADTLLSDENKLKIVLYLKRIGNNQDLLMIGEGLGLTGLRTKLITDTFLHDLVGDWLERKYRVDEVGRPTWRKLVEVLREVGQNGLANDIIEKENILL